MLSSSMSWQGIDTEGKLENHMSEGSISPYPWMPIYGRAQSPPIGLYMNEK